jgi:hypothetical protein
MDAATLPSPAAKSERFSSRVDSTILLADRRGFFKVELWTKDRYTERLPFAGNSDKARARPLPWQKMVAAARRRLKRRALVTSLQQPERFDGTVLGSTSPPAGSAGMISPS